MQLLLKEKEIRTLPFLPNIPSVTQEMVRSLQLVEVRPYAEEEEEEEDYLHET